MITKCIVALKFKNVLSFLYAFLILAAADEALAAIDDHKQICSASQKTKIEAALKKSQGQMSAAATALDNPTPHTINVFSKWLGAPSSDTAKGVAKRLRSGAFFAGFQSYWCPLMNNAEFKWEFGDLAGVHPDSKIDVFFTFDYFDLPLSGQDSQASTLTHEVMHQVGADLWPEIYEKPKLIKLAKVKPADARRNAQSLEYFVEDITSYP